jgi:hypothetical protein
LGRYLKLPIDEQTTFGALSSAAGGALALGSVKEPFLEIAIRYLDDVSPHPEVWGSKSACLKDCDNSILYLDGDVVTTPKQASEHQVTESISARRHPITSRLVAVVAHRATSLRTTARSVPPAVTTW